MRGDATLFTRNDEIQALWGIVDPILRAWHQDTTSPIRQYPAGSAGPPEADAAGGQPLDGCDGDRRRPPADAVTEEIVSRLERHIQDEDGLGATA
jgi:glucose-6-phosphate 1-dehydrogenase